MLKVAKPRAENNWVDSIVCLVMDTYLMSWVN